MRDSFILYRSFYEAICDLDNDSQAQVFKAICEYSLNFKETEMTGIAKTIFKLIKPQLDANNKRFKNGSQPKLMQNESEAEAKAKQKRSKTKANNNVNVNVNNNDNVNNNENNNNNIPTIDDFLLHAIKLNEKINTDQVRYKYDAWVNNGWIDGKGNKIKNWKSKLSNTMQYFETLQVAKDPELKPGYKWAYNHSLKKQVQIPA